MKRVRIRSYSGLYFPAFGLNTDQNNSKYGHFLLGDNDETWHSYTLLAKKDPTMYNSREAPVVTLFVYRQIKIKTAF